MKGKMTNPRPKSNHDENPANLMQVAAETHDFDDAESIEIHSSQDVSRHHELDGLNDDSDGFQMTVVVLKSISLILREIPESKLGWPLLPRSRPPTPDSLRISEARNMSLIDWVMSLPTRSSQLFLQSLIDSNEINSTCHTKIETFAAEDFESEGNIIQVIRNSQNNSIDGSSNGEYEMFGSTQQVSSSYSSALTEGSGLSKPGWPLLRIKISATSDSLTQPETTETSSDSQIGLVLKEAQSPIDKDICFPDEKHYNSCLETPIKLPKKQELLIKLNSSDCKVFSYEELKRATHQFSSENLIGEGGCSNVYKGHLNGKAVAVKVLKQYKEAWNDFSLEVDIMSSLKHKHITPLIGVCNEDEELLILVYDFLSKGSLEEILQGHSKKLVLPWKMRFKVAIAIAEALNYLHNECSPPVIHRDVKSSNILLSDKYQPQLSDFGLALWGPVDSTHLIVSDIVGTFGYIAPEYFMHGRISDKNDVYSFGIVLLELLTGKKPINSNGPKAEKSLAKWATQLIKRGNLKALLDPKFDGDFSTVEVHRMVLAAILCLQQTARLRPTMSQILKLLNREEDEREWVRSYVIDLEKSSNKEIDDVFPDFGRQPSVNFSFLDLDDDASSLLNTALRNNLKQKRRFRLKDYLEERLD